MQLPLGSGSGGVAAGREIESVEVVIRPTLTAPAADVLRADEGYLLGTPANIGTCPARSSTSSTSSTTAFL